MNADCTGSGSIHLPAPPDEALLGALEARLAGAPASPQVVPAWLAFRLAMLRAQCAAFSSVRGSCTPGDHERSGALEPQHLSICAAVAQRLAKEIAGAARAQGRPADPLGRLDDALGGDPGLAPVLARAALASDERAFSDVQGSLGLAREPLEFFGRALAAPFVAAAVLARGVPAHVGTGARCPCCGSGASLATLDREAEGKRRLHCGLCGARWGFSRLECPFCGSTGQRGLGFLRLGDGDHAWLETCERCRRAIKTVDERRLLDPLLPLAEEILGLHLDLFAAREGYQVAPAYVALG